MYLGSYNIQNTLHIFCVHYLAGFYTILDNVLQWCTRISMYLLLLLVFFSELVSNQQGHKGQDSDIEQTYANIAMKQIIIYRWLSHKLHLYIYICYIWVHGLSHCHDWEYPKIDGLIHHPCPFSRPFKRPADFDWRETHETRTLLIQQNERTVIKNIKENIPHRRLCQPKNNQKKLKLQIFTDPCLFPGHVQFCTLTLMGTAWRDPSKMI